MDVTNPAEREKQLFEQALDLSSAAERAAFLKGACGEDSALLARVQALLEANEATGGFLPGQPAGQTTFIPVTEQAGDPIGRYKLRERIGEGGWGVVYVAEQEEPVRRKVALKIIKLGMDTRSVVARFEAERQALAMMDHPNIAKVFDAGATGTGRPYFVMELVRGIKITEYCDQHRLSTRQRLDLFIQVCRAVQHAHQKGIIHRDLKPSNILVTQHDGVPMPKVIDFGIAKATEGRLSEATVYTELRQFMGTPAYMSPEQAEMSGLDVDTRSDIYSLGVLLYELLTGQTPFANEELARLGLDEMRRTIREKEPVRPSTRLSTMVQEELTTTARQRSAEAPRLVHVVHGDLDWVVMKCLEKDRIRRYETATSLARDVERHLANEPVVARPPSLGYRLQKSFRRNKIVFAAITAVSTALVIGVIISTWQAVRATRAQHQADRAQKAADANAIRARAAEKAATNNLQQANERLYAAKMHLAQQAWEQNNVGRLRQLLDETAEYPDRGFEWFYWLRQVHLELKTLRAGQVDAVAVSPDSHRILAGQGVMWDAVSGRELFRLPTHNFWINFLAFSPDGQRLLTAGEDGIAKIWDAASGSMLFTLPGEGGILSSAAFSRDGRQIAMGGWNGVALVWDAHTRTLLARLEGHHLGINALAFSPDGQRIVTGSEDRTAIIWEASTGARLLPLTGHSNSINSVAYSPDGRRILTGSTDSTAKLWDAATGNLIRTFRGHNATVWSVAFSPDGGTLATAGADQIVKLWDATVGTELRTIKGHCGEVHCVAFSPNGQWLVTGSTDGTAKIWDATRNEGPLALEGHTGPILALGFSRDGQRLISSSGDRTIRIWDPVSGTQVRLLEGHEGSVLAVALSPDGRSVVSGSVDQTARLWDAATGIQLHALPGHRSWIAAVAFSADGRRILTAGGLGDGTAKLWDAASATNLLTVTGPGKVVTAAAFAPDGESFVTGSDDSTATVWDMKGTRLLTLRGHGGPIRAVAFSAGGQWIITGSSDTTAILWNARTGAPLRTLKGHTADISSVAFSPDERRIVTGSDDKTAKLWATASGEELLTLNGSGDAVSAVAFSPDGQFIATGHSDHPAGPSYGPDLRDAALRGRALIWQAATPQDLAGWQKEEEAAAARAAILAREQEALRAQKQVVRAQDVGAITQWLVLAPIDLKKRSGSAALDEEQIPGENHLRPSEGERIKVGGKDLTWRALRLWDYDLDFNRVVGETTEWSVGYAVCYLRSQRDQTGVIARVGSDDQSKIYLNGKEVYRSRTIRGFNPDQDQQRGLELKAGLNVLVFEVINETLGWHGSVRLTDANGNALQGITLTLEPDAKDAP